MSRHPLIKLSKIREIGWALWDPIRLASDDGVPADWDCADEYDAYMLAAVGMICRGHATCEVAAYLVKVASEDMGLPGVDRDAATATIHALADYLQSLPDDPGTVR